MGEVNDKEQRPSLAAPKPLGYCLMAQDGRMLWEGECIIASDRNELNGPLEILQDDEPDDGWAIVPFYSAPVSPLAAPSEEACKAAYWARGRQSCMGEEEIAELWPEDRERVIEHMRAEFAILSSFPVSHTAPHCVVTDSACESGCTSALQCKQLSATATTGENDG